MGFNSQNPSSFLPKSQQLNIGIPKIWSETFKLISIYHKYLKALVCNWIPGGLKLDLFRRGLSVGRLFGNRVSVKLCKWFEIGNHGAWLGNEPPRTNRNSHFGDAEVAANEVVEQVEARDSRVRDSGRTMDLRAPNPISRSFCAKLISASNA